MATTTRIPSEVAEALRAQGFGTLSMDKGVRVTLEVVRLIRAPLETRPGETVFRREIERKPGMTDIEFIRLVGAESEMMSAAFLAGLEVEYDRAQRAARTSTVFNREGEPVTVVVPEKEPSGLVCGDCARAAGQVPRGSSSLPAKYTCERCGREVGSLALDATGKRKKGFNVRKHLGGMSQ